MFNTIVNSYDTENILFDPHTATAIKGNKDLNLDTSELVTFATAHPAKFPDAINKELDIFAEENVHLIKKSHKSFWDGFSSKMKSVQNEKTVLRINYAQWRNVYKNYQLLEGDYDLIVKYRYDANGGNFDISKYMENMTSDSIFMREQPYNPHSFKLDNGKEVVMSFDYFKLF